MTAEDAARAAHRSYGMRLSELARERRTFVLRTGAERLSRPIYAAALARYDRAVSVLIAECRALETIAADGTAEDAGRMMG